MTNIKNKVTVTANVGTDFYVKLATIEQLGLEAAVQEAYDRKMYHNEGISELDFEGQIETEKYGTLFSEKCVEFNLPGMAEESFEEWEDAGYYSFLLKLNVRIELDLEEARFLGLEKAIKNSFCAQNVEVCGGWIMGWVEAFEGEKHKELLPYVDQDALELGVKGFGYNLTYVPVPTKNSNASEIIKYEALELKSNPTSLVNISVSYCLENGGKIYEFGVSSIGSDMSDLHTEAGYSDVHSAVKDAYKFTRDHNLAVDNCVINL